MAKFCSKCGNPLGANDVFCPGCGAKIADGGQLSAQPTALEATEPQTIPLTAPAVVPNQNNGYINQFSEQCTNPDAILLKSPAPIHKPVSWINIVYIASILLSFINIGIGIVLAAIAFIVQGVAMDWNEGKMRRMKFKFVGPVTLDDVYNRLQPALSSKLGSAVEFDRDSDSVSVIYDSIIYDISINNDNTFGVWWRKSITGAFFTFNEFKKNRKIRTGTALIAYELQKAFGVQ